MSEWLLVYLEESAQGIFWMDLSLTIVMVDIEMLLICTHNSYLFFLKSCITGNWKDLMGK